MNEKEKEQFKQHLKLTGKKIAFNALLFYFLSGFFIIPLEYFLDGKVSQSTIWYSIIVIPVSLTAYYFWFQRKKREKPFI